MGALIEMDKRDGMRAAVQSSWEGCEKPSITDRQSKKDFDKFMKDYQEDFLDGCSGILYDYRALRIALDKACKRAGMNAEMLVEEVYAGIRIDEKTQQIFDRRRCEEAERRLKEAKERGEVPGQLSLLKDDKSVAEQASDVRTYRLGEKP